MTNKSDPEARVREIRRKTPLDTSAPWRENPRVALLATGGFPRRRRRDLNPRGVVRHPYPFLSRARQANSATPPICYPACPWDPQDTPRGRAGGFSHAHYSPLFSSPAWRGITCHPEKPKHPAGWPAPLRCKGVLLFLVSER